MRNRQPVVSVAMVVIIIIVIALGALINTKSPCGMYKFSPASEIPARCLSHYTNAR